MRSAIRRDTIFTTIQLISIDIKIDNTIHSKGKIFLSHPVSISPGRRPNAEE
jgi:hypothetical protein